MALIDKMKAANILQLTKIAFILLLFACSVSFAETDTENQETVRSSKTKSKPTPESEKIEKEDVEVPSQQPNKDADCTQFGCGTILPMETVKKGFMKPPSFFDDFVTSLVPVKFSAGGLQLPAVEKWGNDSYFNLVPQSSTLWINVTLKDGKTQSKKFRQFVQDYKISKEVYIGRTPSFLRLDLSLPRSLNCPPVQNILTREELSIAGDQHGDAVRSVAEDQLICQVAGNATLAMADSNKFRHKLPAKAGDITTANEVDFVKFPKLKEVEYYRETLVPGDCVFIPTKWYFFLFHTGRAITHTIRWKHQLTTVTAKSCGRNVDKPTPLSALNFTDMPKDQEENFSDDALVHYFGFYLEGGKKTFTKAGFYKRMQNDTQLFAPQTSWNDEYEEISIELFEDLDTNFDKVFTQKDLDKLDDKRLGELRGLLLDRIQDLGDIMKDQIQRTKTEVNSKAKVDDYVKEMSSKLKAEMDEKMKELEEKAQSFRKLSDADDMASDMREQLRIAKEKAKVRLDAREKAANAPEFVEKAGAYTDGDGEVEEILAEDDEGNAAAKSDSKKSDKSAEPRETNKKKQTEESPVKQEAKSKETGDGKAPKDAAQKKPKGGDSKTSDGATKTEKETDSSNKSPKKGDKKPEKGSPKSGKGGKKASKAKKEEL